MMATAIARIKAWFCGTTGACYDPWREEQVRQRDAAIEATGHLWADRLSGKDKT